MTSIGTPLSPTATKVLLCGGGELGKPEVKGQRRMGVALARDKSVEAAKLKAINASKQITTTLS